MCRHGATAAQALGCSIRRTLPVVHGSASTLSGGVFDPAVSSSIGDQEINIAINAGTNVIIQTSAGPGVAETSRSTVAVTQAVPLPS